MKPSHAPILPAPPMQAAAAALRRRVRGMLGALVVALGLTGVGRAHPVSFEFEPPASPDAAGPFAREIFAEVTTPSGATVRLPAFFAGAGQWAVRARASEAGEYTLARVLERAGTGERDLEVDAPQGRVRSVAHADPLPPVRRHPADTARLMTADGSSYVPIGANLAWAAGPRLPWYEHALGEFARHDLNWTRIWMCHWGGTNLDWLPEDLGPSPAPGELDLRVAATWDAILALAGKHGVYVQVVLQHHGQYTTGANANWAINPWNAANPGGFLAGPVDFFTSPRAIELTKQKYRYIVARWAWSPAILCWELFNEVHWTNGYTEDEPAVAAWHAEMAAYLRSIDPYGHLVTTSLDDLRSPIYAAMDYYQPHLYAINMLTGVREFEGVHAFDRPVFWGEIGDDKMPVSPAEKAGGSQLVPQVWASLMGTGPLPGQSWLGELFLRTDRLGELGAVARFLRETQLALRPDLIPFSPPVESADTMPWRVLPGNDWVRHRPRVVTLPLDGSDALAANLIPGILVGGADSIAEGYSPEITLVFDLPAATTARITFADAGVRGAIASVLVDGTLRASHRWPAEPGAPASGPQPAGAPIRPAGLTVPLDPGTRHLTLRNAGGEDWVRLEAVEFDLPTAVIAAAGKRHDTFMTLWVWNKIGVHALAPSAPATATLVLDAVPPGRWSVVWWDADRGIPGAATPIQHDGGTLRLPTPPITRHAAVVLTRE